MRHQEHPACAHFLALSLLSGVQLARLTPELLPQALLSRLSSFVSVSGSLGSRSTFSSSSGHCRLRVVVTISCFRISASLVHSLLGWPSNFKARPREAKVVLRITKMSTCQLTRTLGWACELTKCRRSCMYNSPPLPPAIPRERPRGGGRPRSCRKMRGVALGAIGPRPRSPAGHLASGVFEGCVERLWFLRVVGLSF